MPGGGWLMNLSALDWEGSWDDRPFRALTRHDYYAQTGDWTWLRVSMLTEKGQPAWVFKPTRRAFRRSGPVGSWGAPHWTLRTHDPNTQQRLERRLRSAIVDAEQALRYRFGARLDYDAATGEISFEDRLGVVPSAHDFTEILRLVRAVVAISEESAAEGRTIVGRQAMFRHRLSNAWAESWRYLLGVPIIGLTIVGLDASIDAEAPYWGPLALLLPGFFWLWWAFDKRF